MQYINNGVPIAPGYSNGLNMDPYQQRQFGMNQNPYGYGST